MILLTVGTQLPFDRLVKAMDQAAPQLNEAVFAQIGNGQYLPDGFDYCRMMPPADLMLKFANASLIVSHAGTGSLLTARRYAKPIILFPRRASLGEHRNDHQLATCQQMEGRPGVFVAHDETQLFDLLQRRSPANAAPAGQTDAPKSGLGRSIANYIRRL
jgi:UDP-N-acetylglucosamine transferase subunit ALG13